MGNVQVADGDSGTAWPALVRAYQDVRRDAEAALKRHGLKSLEEYDALLELRRAARPLSISELEAETLLQQYQISRLIERLEARGLVERAVAPADGRSRLVTLTKAGRLTQKAAGRAYAEVLDNRFAERLAGDELAMLRRLLLRVGAD